MNSDEVIRGNLSLYRTDDGSISLRSSIFHEGFHCTSGALKEAREKFLLPAELDRFTSEKKINLLDVCFGMGYNTACIIEKLIRNSIKFNWWGLEVDSRPIEIGLENLNYRSLWDLEVCQILSSLNDKGYWKNKTNKGKILWGDARQTLSVIPKNITFNLILLDAFSPVKCPMLWTEEFLYKLASKLAPEGRLITYCTAAAIRKSMRKSGLTLFSRMPIDNRQRRWSNGTIGILDKNEIKKIKHISEWTSLTPMEEEHLLTKASVPYRDPSGLSSKTTILGLRQKEQATSEMESTSNWKRRWEQTE